MLHSLVPRAALVAALSVALSAGSAAAGTTPAVRAYPTLYPPGLLPLGAADDEAPGPAGSLVFGAGPASASTGPTTPTPADPPLSTPTPSSPAAAQSFAAAEFAFAIPPDTMGAASESWLLVTLNDAVQFQTRSGTVVGATTLEDFFAPTGIADAFDPKVIYDANSGRFYFVACADRRSGLSSMVLAVSETEDPTGAWDYYHFDGDASNSNWVDYPNVGINGRWFVFTANMFAISDDSFQGVNIWAVDLASLTSGGPASDTLFYETAVGGTLVPAQHYTAADPTLYIANTVNPLTGSVALHTITGTGPNPTFNGLVHFIDDQPWNATFPDGEQAGGFDAIDAGDDRGMNAVVRDGSLWFTHGVAYPATGTATHVASRWYQMDPTAGTILQRGEVEDPAGNIDYIYPSIAVNEDGAMMLGFSFVSPSIFPSGGYAFRSGSDAPGTLQSVQTLKAGEAGYELYLSGTRNRWGDYSATMVDPLDGTSFWTLQEYAAAPGDTWGTWWGRVTTNCACADVDGDGHYPTACSDATCGDLDDCDDLLAASHPGATELCDGFDNDCDGALDAPLGEADVDADGSFACADCDDTDATVQAAGQEVCNGLDDDCDDLADEEVRTSLSGTGSVRLPPIGTSGTTSVPMVISSASSVVDVDLSVDIEHDESSDLRLTLLSPSGTGVVLVDGEGSGADFSGTTFDDEASSNITQAANPFAGAFIPEQLLAAFDGEPAGGTWTLQIVDQSIGTFGTLVEWSLSVGYDGAGDVDRDGAVACFDCDDSEPASFPGNAELCDGLDNDCTPGTPEGDDADGDGTASCAGDCDEGDPATFPGATEICDGADNDCDGVVPAFDADEDGDGAALCAGDCDDADTSIAPGATEGCDGIDANCDGIHDEADTDGDGAYVCGGDCDDTDPSIHPAAAELCDGVDQDCDSHVDERITVVASGAGALAVPPTGSVGTTTSVAPVLQDGVVEDVDVRVHVSHGQVGDLEISLVAPSGAEVVLVQNEGGSGDHFTQTLFDDEATIAITAASPPFSGSFRPVQALSQLDAQLSGGDWTLVIDDGGAGEAGTLVSWTLSLVVNAGGDQDGDGVGGCFDCDDEDADIAPGATEVCNGLDDDCSGVLSGTEVDVDGDGLAPCAGDCDDEDASISPAATEICNGVDDDCGNGPASDERDEDGDLVRICDGDCDDLDDALFAGNAEVCDGHDQDCDGQAPGEVDADLDGFLACGPDCDDLDETVYDGAPEFCDGLDQNCDGQPEVQEEIEYFDWYIDVDGDGFGDPANPWGDNPDCAPPEGYVRDRTDCDDRAPTAFPGGLGETGETCIDGLDNDCDGVADWEDEHCAALLQGDTLAPGWVTTCSQSGGGAHGWLLGSLLLPWFRRSGRRPAGPRRAAAQRPTPLLAVGAALMLLSPGWAQGAEDEAASGDSPPPSTSEVPPAAPAPSPPLPAPTETQPPATSAAPAGSGAALVVTDHADIGRSAMDAVVGREAPLELRSVPSGSSLYGVWLLGAQVGAACAAGTIPVGEVGDELDRARKHLSASGWFAVRATIEELRPRLSCVGGVLPPDTLYEIHRLEAIGNFKSRGGFSTVEAIQRAVGVHQDLQLDPSWPPEFGKLWLETQQERQGAAVAMVRSFAGDEGKTGEAWIDGRRIDERGLTALAGEHLVQVRGSDGRIHGAWLNLAPGDLFVVGDAARSGRGLRSLPAEQRGRLAQWFAARLGASDSWGVHVVDAAGQVATLARGVVVETRKDGQQVVKNRSRDALPRFSAAVGGGWSVLSTFHYGHVSLDLGGRLVGPLRIEGGLRLAFGARSTSPIDGAVRVPVLMPFGLGLGLRIPAKVRPFFGLWFQGAVTESGSEAARLYGIEAPAAVRTFLPGVLARGGVEIPLGRSPLDVRPFVEGGVLGTLPTVRAGIALGVER